MLAESGAPLFVDFVNTLHWYEGQPIELIGSQADLAAWLAEHGLAAGHLDAACLASLHALRQHARAATEALATAQPPQPADLAALGAALSAVPGHLVLEGLQGPQPQLVFQPAADDSCGLAAFRVALSFASFLSSGQRGRLKLCANPGCGFAFVDTSTNGTRRWCFMRYCGNRLKVRAFRRRRVPA
jgi:predicted RNA-binding Zn ribbon-like protein